jgi:hypothetical protein
MRHTEQGEIPAVAAMMGTLDRICGAGGCVIFVVAWRSLPEGKEDFRLRPDSS